MQVDLKDLKDLLLEIAPGRFWGSLGARTNPLTPLLFFCAFTLLAAVSLGVFNKTNLACWAFALFSVTIIASFVTYCVCLCWWPDKLRSESYDLALRRTTLRGSGIPTESDETKNPLLQQSERSE